MGGEVTGENNEEPNEDISTTPVHKAEVGSMKSEPAANSSFVTKFAHDAWRITP